MCTYRLVRFSSFGSVISGFVWVREGRFFISLIIFFCILISGCMYVLFGLEVPHIVIFPIRCGYACW